MTQTQKSALDVAYFTMEIGLKGDIPTFAGGLGILAADLMQSSADLGLACACVTVCWQHGYLKQEIHEDGSQQYQEIDWQPEKELTKLPQTVTVQIEGHDVKVGAWMKELRGHKGTVPVYFLDTNLPENRPGDRDITKNLYGGDQAMRIRQEIVLGFGGVKMLRALGYEDIRMFHMNEGHCAFLTLELLRERNFNDEAVKGSCAFTTHTPVKAGHDVFPYDLAWKIAGNGLPWHIKKLAGDDALSMTQLALSLSRYICGVSQVHGQVSRRMFNRSDIDAITNGVHHETWCGPEMQSVFDSKLPGWRENPSLLASAVDALDDRSLWTAHQQAKIRLLKLVNANRQDPFEPHILTIASARRVVAYKRPELLYTNLQRLKEIGCGKLQIIHAGNAHPGDAFAMDVIRHMVERSKELRDCVKIAYLPNYNPDLAKLLVAGADVWLNTPTRLHEASGTSGMKAALNGTLNLSTLDGWWIEAYEMNHEAGWRIGPLASSLNADDTRAVDAEDLYTQLEFQVIPEYGAPDKSAWIRRMKQSIALLGHFNSQRCVEEYIQKAWK